MKWIIVAACRVDNKDKVTDEVLRRTETTAGVRQINVLRISVEGLQTDRQTNGNRDYAKASQSLP